MQNTNRRRRGHWYTQQTAGTHINTHTDTQKRGYGRIIDWRWWKWSCSTENRGPQLFVPCCISLSETPANTHATHTHTRTQRTSPFPKAVCLPSMHTAQKEENRDTASVPFTGIWTRSWQPRLHGHSEQTGPSRSRSRLDTSIQHALAKKALPLTFYFKPNNRRYGLD